MMRSIDSIICAFLRHSGIRHRWIGMSHASHAHSRPRACNPPNIHSSISSDGMENGRIRAVHRSCLRRWSRTREATCFCGILSPTTRTFGTTAFRHSIPLGKGVLWDVYHELKGVAGHHFTFHHTKQSSRANTQLRHDRGVVTLLPSAASSAAPKPVEANRSWRSTPIASPAGHHVRDP